ncbi:hypothetical protein VTK73DRAFT_40 [Phialemonium thermophilum]|uniref:Uncharacterized protein n=1 Tax=Phialemonium thermophilum TaxID=223376 RepID=A0ABR3Y7R2_9PEZI
MKSHGVAPGGGNRGTTSAVDNPKGALPNSRKRKAPATEDMDDPEDIKPSTDAGAKKAAGPKKEVKGEVKQEAKAEFKLEPQSSVKEEAKVKKERAHVKKDEAVTVPDNGLLISHTIPKTPQVGNGHDIHDGERLESHCLMCATARKNSRYHISTVGQYGSRGNLSLLPSTNNVVSGMMPFDFYEAADKNLSPQTMIARSDAILPRSGTPAWPPVYSSLQNFSWRRPTEIGHRI